VTERLNLLVVSTVDLSVRDVTGAAVGVMEATTWAVVGAIVGAVVGISVTKTGAAVVGSEEGLDEGAREAKGRSLVTTGILEGGAIVSVGATTGFSEGIIVVGAATGANVEKGTKVSVGLTFGAGVNARAGGFVGAGTGEAVIGAGIGGKVGTPPGHEHPHSSRKVAFLARSQNSSDTRPCRPKLSIS
jgi:hypothetical protein